MQQRRTRVSVTRVILTALATVAMMPTYVIGADISESEFKSGSDIIIVREVSPRTAYRPASPQGPVSAHINPAPDSKAISGNVDGNAALSASSRMIQAIEISETEAGNIRASTVGGLEQPGAANGRTSSVAHVGGGGSGGAVESSFGLSSMILGAGTAAGGEVGAAVDQATAGFAGTLTGAIDQSIAPGP